MPRQSLSLLLTTLLMGMLLSACGQPMGTRQARQDSAEAAPQEKQCMAKGWQRVAVQISGVPRELLWKAPSGPWLKGTIIVLHGGGGQHF